MKETVVFPVVGYFNLQSLGAEFPCSTVTLCSITAL